MANDRISKAVNVLMATDLSKPVELNDKPAYGNSIMTAGHITMPADFKPTCDRSADHRKMDNASFK